MGNENAIAWVNANKGLVINEAKKFENFTPYERSDFLQDAYEAAILATAVAKEKNLAFEACFWVLFRRRIANMTPNPLSRRHSGCNSPVTTQCRELDEWVPVQSPVSQDQRKHDVERLFHAVRQHLSEVERQVWVLALGLTRKGRLNNYEIAQELGCSAANVRQAITRVINRMARMANEGKLQVQLSDIELRHLQLINGLTSRPEQLRSHKRASSRSSGGQRRKDAGMKEIGSKLRVIRGGRTLEEFAKSFGIHKNTLASYEKGGRSPSGDFLLALCQEEGVDPRWLLDSGGHPLYQRDLLERTANILSTLSPQRLGPRTGKLLVNIYERAEALGEVVTDEDIRRIASNLFELLGLSEKTPSAIQAQALGGEQWQTG